MSSKERNRRLGQGGAREGTGRGVETSGAWVGAGLRVKDGSREVGDLASHPQAHSPSPDSSSPSSHPGQSEYSPSARPVGRVGGSTWQRATG